MGTGCVICQYRVPSNGVHMGLLAVTSRGPEMGIGTIPRHTAHMRAGEIVATTPQTPPKSAAGCCHAATTTLATEQARHATQHIRGANAAESMHTHGGSIAQMHEMERNAAPGSVMYMNRTGNEPMYQHTRSNPVDPARAQQTASDVAAGTQRFADVNQALAEGYSMRVAGGDLSKDMLFYHFKNESLINDGDLINPNRPEELIYYKHADGSFELAGAVYVTPPGVAGPDLGGGSWHSHGTELKSQMLHVWLNTTDIDTMFGHARPKQLYQR